MMSTRPCAARHAQIEMFNLNRLAESGWRAPHLLLATDGIWDMCACLASHCCAATPMVVSCGVRSPSLCAQLHLQPVCSTVRMA
eukprot:6212886-Pleurochrysis_carterae.AAC.2